MFGLNEAQYNIVKQTARRMAAEAKDAIKKEKKSYDQVAAKMIDKHWSSVNTLVTRGQFIWIAGYLEGRFGRKDGEYE
ncbi:hypothetical protein [Klebsiella phage vB_KpnS-VAC2]|uniref:Uncharacterized protein n=1 Tax=Klebsiella phage vB_KpnS-VAC2 TaxID=2864369 RepID=A0AAE8C261_9CAUD|nr:hypothetical protein [Klebsiella phage vB_KpnS-VAC2]